MATGTRPIAIGNAPSLDTLPAMGAGDHGMTSAPASHVNQRQRNRIAVGQPAIPELHQRDEAWIQIEPHLGESIFFTSRRPARDLTENGELRQLSQAIGQGCAWNAERGAKGLEGLRSKEGFADDQECPGIGNNVERSRDRAVALAPHRIGAGLARFRSRSDRQFRGPNLGSGSRHRGWVLVG